MKLQAKQWSKNLLNQLLDLAYPRDCLISGEPLSGRNFDFLSDTAVARLPMIKDPHCTTCGHPFSGVVEREVTCFHCEELNPVYKEGRCAYLYMRDVKVILHSCKYRNRPYMGKDLARLLYKADGMPEYLRHRIIIPVPLHPRKQRERGFNQTSLILHYYNQITPEPLEIKYALKRVLDTESQTIHNRKERLKSVQKAFVLDPNCPLDKNREYMIFDDVFTTGSTLNTCAQALCKAGIPSGQIYVAAFAHG